MSIFYVPNASQALKMPSPILVTEKNISTCIRTLHPFKAAGNDAIVLFVEKSLENSLVSFIKPIFLAGIDFS